MAIFDPVEYDVACGVKCAAISASSPLSLPPLGPLLATRPPQRRGRPFLDCNATQMLFSSRIHSLHDARLLTQVSPGCRAGRADLPAPQILATIGHSSVVTARVPLPADAFSVGTQGPADKKVSGRPTPHFQSTKLVVII